MYLSKYLSDTFITCLAIFVCLYHACRIIIYFGLVVFILRITVSAIY